MHNNHQLQYTSTNLFDNTISDINRLISIYEEEGKQVVIHW